MKSMSLFIFIIVLMNLFFSAEASKVSTDLKLYFVDVYNKPLSGMDVSIKNLEDDNTLKNITTTDTGLIILTQTDMPDNQQFYFVVYNSKGSLIYDTKKITFKDSGTTAGFCKYEDGKQKTCVVTLDTMHGLNLRGSPTHQSIKVFVKDKKGDKIKGTYISMYRSDNNNLIETKKVNNDGYATFVFPSDTKIYFSAKSAGVGYTSYNQTNYIFVSATKNACAESFRFPYFCGTKVFTEFLTETSDSKAKTQSAGLFGLLPNMLVDAVEKVNENLANKFKKFLFTGNDKTDNR